MCGFPSNTLAASAAAEYSAVESVNVYVCLQPSLDRSIDVVRKLRPNNPSKPVSQFFGRCDLLFLK